MGLTFADPVFLGGDPTVTISQEVQGKTLSITVNRKEYQVLDQFWRGAMISGRGTKCFLVTREGRLYVIKDTWVVVLRTPSEIFFLQEAEAAGVEGVARIVDWQDVTIDNVVGSTDLNCRHFKDLSGCVHRCIVLEGFADPLSSFCSKMEIICAFINFIISKWLIFLTNFLTYLIFSS